MAGRGSETLFGFDTGTDETRPNTRGSSTATAVVVSPPPAGGDGFTANGFNPGRRDSRVGRDDKKPTGSSIRKSETYKNYLDVADVAEETDATSTAYAQVDVGGKKILSRGTVKRTASLAEFRPMEKKSKSKADKRTSHDLLLDHLVNLNMSSTARLESDKVFEDGFGGSGGNDRDYWRPRIQEENRKVGQKSTKHQPVEVFRTPDNTTFTHHNSCLRDFFELGGYRAFPEVVTVAVEVREILSVDVAAGTFRLAMIVTTRWYDAFFDKHTYLDQLEFYTTTRPYITFDHVDEGDDPVGLPADAGALTFEQKHCGQAFRKPLDPPGVLYHSQRIQATFRVENDLRDFPFDIQRLSINIRLWGANVKDDADHGRILLPLSTDMKLAHRHLEWHAYQATGAINRRRMDRQDLEVTITLRRRANFFVNNVYIILWSMPTMSLFTFAVPQGDEGFVNGYESRCQITLTLMLSSIAYKFYLEGMLPKAPYLTRLDSYINWCFGMICLMFFCNTLSLVFERYEGSFDRDWLVHLEAKVHSEADTTSLSVFVDKIFFYVVTLLWIIVNIYQLFILTRKSRHKIETFLLSRVASDQDDAKFKRHKEYENALTTWNESNQRIGDAKPVKVSLSKPDKRLMDDVDRLKEARKEYNRSIAFYSVGTKTLRLRRMNTLALFKEWESKQSPKDKTKFPKGYKNAHCDCQACRARREPVHPESAILTLCRSADIAEEKGPELTNKFAAHKVSLSDVKRIFNNGQGASAAQELLKSLDLDNEDSVKILASLSLPFTTDRVRHLDQPEVICLQGSSSYLMLGLKPDFGPASKSDLNLGDTLLKTSEFRARLQRELHRIKTTPNVLHDITLTANICFASVILSSPRAQSEYLYSQRTFANKADPKFIIASQVWCGYLMHRPAKEWDNGGAIAVDIGTGKMAFGYAVKAGVYGDVKSVDLSKFEQPSDEFFELFKCAIEAMDVRYENYDKDPEANLASAKSQLDAAQHLLKEEENKGNLADKERIRERDEEVKTSLMWYRRAKMRVLADTQKLEWISRSLFSSIIAVREAIKNKGETLRGTEPIFFFGTMKMRDWLKHMEIKHGARCYEMLSGLADYMTWHLPDWVTTHGGGHSAHKVYFRLCEQADEARCEHKAFMTALSYGNVKDKNAVQVIDRALKSYSVGNIAWGNGSMQGIPSPAHCDSSEQLDFNVVAAEMGLNQVKEIIKKNVSKVRGTITKKEFSCADDATSTKVLNNTIATIRRKLSELSPRLGIAPEEQADLA